MRKAEVSATSVSCIDSDGVCTIQLTNTGSANTNADGCTISGSEGILSPSPVLIQAGSSAQVTCATGSGQGRGAGNAVSGSIPLTNGASVEWVGTWQ
jgi:hypothetical protein